MCNHIVTSLLLDFKYGQCQNPPSQRIKATSSLGASNSYPYQDLHLKPSTVFFSPNVRHFRGNVRSLFYFLLMFSTSASKRGKLISIYLQWPLVCLYSNASSSFSSTVNSLWVARIFNFFQRKLWNTLFVHSPYLLYTQCWLCNSVSSANASSLKYQRMNIKLEWYRCTTHP